MKRYGFALAIAFLLMLACDRKNTFLPTWSEQLAKLGFTPSGISTIDVEFGGPILHVVEGNKRRSVLVRDPSGKHIGILVVRVADPAEFIAAFPPADFPATSDFPAASCLGTTCFTTLDRVGLRISALNDGPSLNKFDKTHPSFEKPVQHLGPKGQLKPEYIIKTLHDDVDDDVPPMSSPVFAYMQLEGGGELTAASYPCDAKFDGEPNTAFRPFGSTSTLRLQFSQGAILHVRTPKSGGWKKIRLTGTHVPILVANFSKTPNVSHFHLLAKLSNDPNQKLPDVIERPGCIKMFGGVPGCGNNQWP